MAEEHDSWLAGIGVDVVSFLESVPEKIEEAVSGGGGGSGASTEPISAEPANQPEVCEEPQEDVDKGMSQGQPAAAASSSAASAVGAPVSPAKQVGPSSAIVASTKPAPSDDEAAKNRPKKPSSPGSQMGALLSAAKSGATKVAGKCYAAFKRNVKAAGGYGDILDIYTDERFASYQKSALQFADAVKANGAANLGLQEVGGADPRGAKPGTILVLKGNGNGLISDAYGDISVVGETEKGIQYCYNDGKMALVADDKSWATGGRYANMMVAMYIPIARSAE